MAKYPGLTKREAADKWYVVRTIPVEAQLYFKSSQIWRSTRTSDLSEAKLNYASILAEVDAEIAAKVRLENPNVVSGLSDTEIERLSALHYHTILDEDEESRGEGMNEKAFSKLSEGIDIALIGSEYDLARGALDMVAGGKDR